MLPETEVVRDETDPRLFGTPAQITIRLLVDREVVGEVKTERPNSAEARAFCRELQREIEVLVAKDRGLIQ